MSKPSKSPDRYSFQKLKSLERWAEEGRTPENDEHVKRMLDFYESFKVRAEENEVDPKWQENNLEYDLRTCDWILEKVRKEDRYAQNLYAALCNNEFRKRDLWPMLAEQNWSCSWRYAGGIVADMRGKGDYIDWYCSGIIGMDDDQFQQLDAQSKERYLYMKNNFVSESVVTDEIREDLFKLGWIVLDDVDDV